LTVGDQEKGHTGGTPSVAWPSSSVKRACDEQVHAGASSDGPTWAWDVRRVAPTATRCCSLRSKLRLRGAISTRCAQTLIVSHLTRDLNYCTELRNSEIGGISDRQRTRSALRSLPSWSARGLQTGPGSCADLSESFEEVTYVSPPYQTCHRLVTVPTIPGRWVD
jgi:hypothetical protein